MGQFNEGLYDYIIASDESDLLSPILSTGIEGKTKPKKL